jgi:isocitrate/isopropylmalate dehydrogenase
LEFDLSFTHLEGGAGCYARTGEALPAASIAAARAADAILLAAMGLPDVRYPDGTEITPQIDQTFKRREDYPAEVVNEPSLNSIRQFLTWRHGP